MKRAGFLIAAVLATLATPATAATVVANFLSSTAIRNAGAVGQSASNGFSFLCCQDVSAGPNTIGGSVPDDISAAALIGVANYGGADHLVLGLNSTFQAVGVEFSTLFPGNTESQIIGALDSYAANGDFPSTFRLFSFGNEVFGTPGAAFAPQGGTFQLVSFSQGALIGSGSSVLLSAAPEPASWAMLIMGFGLGGAALRRQRRQVRAALA